MEFGRSFSYPFQHPSWVLRVLVGAALEVVPLLLIVPVAVRVAERGIVRVVQLPLLFVAVAFALLCRFVVIGYLRRIALDGLRGAGGGLPAWDRFGEDLTEGLKLFLVSLGLLLPAIGITASFAFLFQAMGFPSLAWLPVFLLLPLSLAVTVIYLPAALIAAIAKNDMTAAFDVPRVGDVIGRAFGAYVLAFLIAVATEILAQLGLLLLCVGIFATRFLAHAIVVHAFASVYRLGVPSPESSAAEPVAL